MSRPPAPEAAHPTVSRQRPAETGLVDSGRRRLIFIIVGLVLGLAAGSLFAARGALQNRIAAQQQPLPVGGRMLLPSDNGLSTFDVQARRQAPLLTVAAGEIVSSASWSPKGDQIAYGYFHRRPGDPAMVSEIYLAGADGANPRPLAERDVPGAVLDTPVWTPDGHDVLFAYFAVSSGKSIQRVERIPAAGGQRQVVIDNGYAPALSADGRTLLFLRDERAGTGLWMAPLAGGQPSPVLAPGRYPALAVPRLSPDGSRIAVAVLNSGTAEAPQIDPFAWLLPVPAYAHGNPWDIWTFDLQGQDPRRLTQVNADDPSPAWSPDGRYVAFWGGTGLYIVGADGRDLRQLSDKGGYGPIDWLP